MDRVAGALYAHGVRTGDRVALCLPTADALVALLGVLRAGATYLPLDPAAPAARQHAILSQAAPVLLVHDATAAAPAWPGCATIAFAALGDAPAGALPACIDPQQAAYTLFTSGSTGVPKRRRQPSGRRAQDQALCAAYQMTADDRVVQFSSLVFDVSIEEIFTTLSAGACLLLLDRAAWPTLGAFSGLLDARRATVLNLPASFWREWVRAIRLGEAALPARLRLVVTGSETVPLAAVQAWRAVTGGRVALMNAYGLTESVITSVVHDVPAAARPDERDVPIGAPLPGTTAYVLDAHLQPVPPLCRGELPGRQCARERLSGPARADGGRLPARSVRRPAGRAHVSHRRPRASRYGRRTGLPRPQRSPDQGARDSRHLAEVEALLLEDGVREAAVRLSSRLMRRRRAWRRSSSWTRRMCRPRHAMRRARAACVAPRGAGAWCRTRWPSCRRCPRRPVTRSTASGCRRRCCPTKPRTATKRRRCALLAVLRDVLRLDRIGRDDNYFGLGGDSILVLRAVAQLNRAGWTVDPQDFFSTSTLADRRLPATADGAAGGGRRVRVPADAVSAARVAAPARAPLEPLAARSGGAAARRRRAAGRVPFAARRAPGAAVRIRCPRAGGPHRACGRGRRAALLQQPRPRTADDAAHFIAAHGTTLQQGFDLAHGPLVRIAHYRCGAAGDRLLLVVHGLVADSHGWAVLLDDLANAYAAHANGRTPALAAPTLAYPAYLRALDARIAAARAAGETAAYFAPMAANVALPRDRHAAPGDNAEASQQVVRDRLTGDAARRMLAVVPQRLRVKAATVAIAAAARALTEWAGGAVVADLGRHGRDWLDDGPAVERALGCFVCDVPLLLPHHAGARASPRCARGRRRSPRCRRPRWAARTCRRRPASMPTRGGAAAAGQRRLRLGGRRALPRGSPPRPRRWARTARRPTNVRTC